MQQLLPLTQARQQHLQQQEEEGRGGDGVGWDGAATVLYATLVLLLFIHLFINMVFTGTLLMDIPYVKTGQQLYMIFIISLHMIIYYSPLYHYTRHPLRSEWPFIIITSLHSTVLSCKL